MIIIFFNFKVLIQISKHYSIINYNRILIIIGEFLMNKKNYAIGPVVQIDF